MILKAFGWRTMAADSPSPSQWHDDADVSASAGTSAAAGLSDMPRGRENVLMSAPQVWKFCTSLN